MTDEELGRLKAMADLNLFDRKGDPVLTSLTQQATVALNAPVALVSIVLDGAQVWLASTGLEGWLEEAGGTPVEWAFCRFAVRDKTPFEVEDAHVHPDVQENPLVTQEGVRCYLGMPLVTTDGHAIGTLCVLGSDPRTFSEAERTALAGLADQAMAHLEAQSSK